MVMVSIGGDEVLGSAVAAVIVLDVRLTGYRGDPGNTSSKAICIGTARSRGSAGALNSKQSRPLDAPRSHPSGDLHPHHHPYHSHRNGHWAAWLN